MSDDTKLSPENNFPAGYVPPKVWTQDAESGGAFASINKPTAGAQFERELPVGKHPLQLYSLATPNGVKVNIMLEELLAAGHSDAEYDAWLIKIGDGDQFGSGFVSVNPNSKIPALMDHAPRGGGEPVRFDICAMWDGRTPLPAYGRRFVDALRLHIMAEEGRVPAPARNERGRLHVV